jgi:RHS repeat-associated protein
MTDDTGTVVWEADYKPFGEAGVNGKSTVVNNFRFSGQYFDQETGLHYNWHRYYNPATGRYLTPDPIGLEGKINVYAYAGNNPINWIDPLGLKLKRNQSIVISIAGGAGAVIGGVAVGFTTWGIGAPAGAAIGASLFSTAATSLMGGSISDQLNSAVLGALSGIIGPSVGGLVLNVSKTGLQAAVRTGLLTGAIEAVIIGANPIFKIDTLQPESNICENGYSFAEEQQFMSYEEFEVEAQELIDRIEAMNQRQKALQGY